MNTCKDCRYYRLRYDKDGEATIPYCTEHETDVEPDARADCFQVYRDVD